ncbi:hypothetical protein GCM10029978_103860 [Actinoallomurus acanthiterrae]
MPPVNANSVPFQMYNSWPGIDDPGKLRVNTGQIRVAAKRLEGHLEDLLAATEQLKPPEPVAFGQWDAALSFQPSVAAGHQSLAEQHSRVLHALMSTIKKLHRAANVYDANEVDLERRIAAVDKHLSVQPSADLGGHDPSSAPSKQEPTVPNSLNPDGRN